MISRRTMLRNLALAGTGMFFLPQLNGLDSISFQSGPLKDINIRAFIETIVPGAPINHPEITRMFNEKFYGFSKFKWLFKLDLLKRSLKLFHTVHFHHLNLRSRIKVIEDTLNSGGLIQKLYNGAIYAAQITVYTGYYKEEEGCEFIDFKAKYDDASSTFQDVRDFTNDTLTQDGNLI